MMTLARTIVDDVLLQTPPLLPLGRGRSTVKRVVDLIVAIFLPILTTPLMLVVAIAIRYDNPGTILYKQERIGYHGRCFQILKCRSMMQNAEEDGRTVWAAERDPRVTHIGGSFG